MSQLKEHEVYGLEFHKQRPPTHNALNDNGSVCGCHKPLFKEEGEREGGGGLNGLDVTQFIHTYSHLYVYVHTW